MYRNAILWWFFGLQVLVSACSSLKPPVTRLSDETKDQREKDRALIKKYEDILGMRLNARRSLALYKAIDPWMGVPYVHGAMSRRGTDCSGFTCNIYSQVYNIKLSRSTEDQIKKDVRRIGLRALCEGDLVFFKIEEGKKVSHVGIYLGNHKFVHASTKKGVCISDLTEKYYAERFTRGGRVTVKPKMAETGRK